MRCILVIRLGGLFDLVVMSECGVAVYIKKERKIALQSNIDRVNRHRSTGVMSCSQRAFQHWKIQYRATEYRYHSEETWHSNHLANSCSTSTASGRNWFISYWYLRDHHHRRKWDPFVNDHQVPSDQVIERSKGMMIGWIRKRKRRRRIWWEKWTIFKNLKILNSKWMVVWSGDRVVSNHDSK